MSMRELVHNFLLLIAMLSASAAAQAQLSPATLGHPTSENYFIDLMEFPDTQGDATVRLLCIAIIKANGRVKDQAGCFIKNNWDPDFAAAVQKASKKAQWNPARQGKNGVEVGVIFQVEFLKREDDRTINVYLHSGIAENIEEYGPNHISAQRAVGKESWQDTCPKRADWMLFAKAHVNEEGAASSVDLEHGNGLVPTGPCQQAIIDTLTSSRFSPAMIDGVPVPSSYVEPFGN